MRTIFFEAMGTMFIGLVLSASMASAAGDPMKGVKAYRACKACHTLEPGRHMTGPSLAGIWNRKAGTIEGFTRSSPALKSANIIWDAKTLDHWLASPGTLIPGNWMTFSGIKDPQARADLIAYLKSVTAQRPEGKTAKKKITSRGPRLPNLKQIGPAKKVTAIGYCGDTYTVETADGKSRLFWEFNLRFKTDSSENGPVKGHPALLRASMMGDRAFIVFASPAELSTLIRPTCEK